MEISDAQIKRLLRVPWLPFADKETKTNYLLKFFASPEDVACWVLITDTRRVWAEVLQGRHISRRADQLDPPTTDLTWKRTEKQERRFRRNWLESLHAAHCLSKLDEVEIEVGVGTEYADLSIKITTPNITWCWNGFALGLSKSAEIVSEHLVKPLMTVTSVALGAQEAPRDMSAEDVQKCMDKTGKTARAAQHTHIKALFMKPFVACGVPRVTGIMDNSDEMDLHPIVQDLTDLPEPATLDFGAESSSEIGEEDYQELVEPGRDVVERDFAYEIPHESDGPIVVRSSPAPMEDGSGTEDDEDEGDTGTQAATQLESQAQSQYGAKSQLQSNARLQLHSATRTQSQIRPPIQTTRSQPQPVRRGPSTTAQGLRSLSQPQSRAGTSMLQARMRGGQSQSQRPGGQRGGQSQSQMIGSKRTASDSDSEDDERAEELKRRMRFGATIGGIGKKMRAAKKTSPATRTSTPPAISTVPATTAGTSSSTGTAASASTSAAGTATSTSTATSASPTAFDYSKDKIRG
ncbi:hypothetical protein FRC07_009092, partial [Ceratobasidium sp. 392]